MVHSNPPSEFEPKQIELKDYPPAPPKPPTVHKKDLCPHLHHFEKIDEHAKSEAENSYPTFRDLIWNLLYKHEFNDLEKARTVFRWIVALNPKSLKFDEVHPNSPEELLMNYASGKLTSSRVYECLIKYGGLPCVAIPGWAKGSDYCPESMLMTSRPANHSWNVVYIDGHWQIVDSHWAKPSPPPLSDKPLPEDEVQPEYNDFYFLPDPEVFIYSHYPHRNVWQLLDNPLSANEFEELPLTRHHFFQLDLNYLQQRDGVVFTRDGKATITLGFSRPTTFTYKLHFMKGEGEIIDDLPANRYVLQEIYDNRVTYYFRAPKAGGYLLNVFAREAIKELPKQIVYKGVCDFLIVSEEESRLPAFPYCSDAGWGLDMYTDRYPIKPFVRSAILITKDGHISVSLAKHGDVRLYVQLIKDGMDFFKLKDCVKVEEKDGNFVVEVRLPEPGEFGLEVFANDKEKDGETYSHLCQYLICFSKDDFPEVYGTVYDREDIPLDYAAQLPTYHRKRGIDIGDIFVDLAKKQGKEKLPTETADDYSVGYPLGDTSKARKSIAYQPEPEKEYEPHPDNIYEVQVDIQPPGDFSVHPVDKDSKPSAAPSSMKEKPFISVEVFKKPDEHAQQVAQNNHPSFRDLMWNLVYARDISNELEKARVIFVWLCSLNLEALSFDHVEKNSPEDVLMKLKHGQETYARAYETLCLHAGLNCVALSGYAKGSEYKPGMKFSGDHGQHSWNAVLVNDRWHLVDCHWAARRIVGKEVMSEKISFDLDEYYFMPDPNQLIFTHFPTEPVWQLIQPPLTLNEFEELVPVKSAFFKHGLKILSHRNAVLKTNQETTVMISCPESKAKSIAFTFTLTYNDGRDEFKGIKLNQYGMHEMVDHIAFFTVRPPEKGSYLLVIYAKDLEHDTKEGVYGGVCEYEICCEDTPTPELKPFPSCVHTSWGPGDSYANYKLVPKQKGAVICTQQGIAEVEFLMEGDYRFSAKLKGAGDDEKELARCIMSRVVHNHAIFRIIAPHHGEYGLEIYANDPAVDGQTLRHVYQYLVICKDAPSSVEQFPLLPTGYLGPQELFKSLGLTSSNQKDPYIESSTGEVQLSFGMSKDHPLKTTAQLLYESPHSDDNDKTEYVLQQSGGGDSVTFFLKLPKPGMYKFQLFASPMSESSESLPGVYNALIYCRSTFVSLVPFPKQFATWKEGCYLYEPLEGHLQSNRPSKGSASTYQHVLFKMDVPRAKNVSAVIGEEWFKLDQKHKDTWEGEVLMEKFWEKERKAVICCCYDDEMSNFATLLEYSM